MARRVGGAGDQRVTLPEERIRIVLRELLFWNFLQNNHIVLKDFMLFGAR